MLLQQPFMVRGAPTGHRRNNQKREDRAGGPTFSFTGEIGMQNLAKKINLLNRHGFAMISNEIKPGSFNNLDAVPSTDWQKLVFRTAPIYNFQLSASGATKSMQYYISGGYFKQEGIIEKSKYERITLQLNNTYLLSPM